MHINFFIPSLAVWCILYFLNHIQANSPELNVINSSALVEIDNDINRTQRGNKITVRSNKNPLSVGDNNKAAAKQGAAAKTTNGGSGARQSEHDSLTSRKTREPVKLTMKQGLTMNQVIATYALSGVKNALCKNHTEEFKRGLRALEPWALQMFDSSSKVMSGILNGNLVEYGAYRQCLNIYENTEYGPIRGRHCSFRVTPTEKLLRIILGYRNVSAKV